MNIIKTKRTLQQKPPHIEEIARLILVLIISLCLPMLLAGYFFTHEAALLMADGLIGIALAKILPYYFKQ